MSAIKKHFGSTSDATKDIYDCLDNQSPRDMVAGERQ